MNLSDAFDKVKDLFNGKIDKNVFDVDQFVKDVKDVSLLNAQKAISSSHEAYQDFQQSIDNMGNLIKSTLEAMKTETNPDALQLLQDDLSFGMPALAASAKSRLMSRVASDVENTFEAIWDFIVKAAVTAAKAFIASL